MLREANCKKAVYILPNAKVIAAKDDGENYIKVSVPVVQNFNVLVYTNHMKFKGLCLHQFDVLAKGGFFLLS